jgi:hypothetical protein
MVKISHFLQAVQQGIGQRYTVDGQMSTTTWDDVEIGLLLQRVTLVRMGFWIGFPRQISVRVIRSVLVVSSM